MRISENLKNKFWPYLLWIGGANLFFFVVYGYCNYYASQLPSEKLYQLYFPWELNIPLIPWMILPYRSIEIIFYTSIFFLDHHALKKYGIQMMAAMIIAAIIFIVFPGECGFVRPDPELLGGYKIFFKILYYLDKPHNLYPSLHITYSYLGLRAFYDFTKSRKLKLTFTLWFILICFSVIFTHQHHLFDLILGLILGVFTYSFSDKIKNIVYQNK
jgi:membrane-associated phospholipid phosphatase